jgi:hypothetical protein
MNSLPPDLPPGVRAAMLDKQQGPTLIGAGANPPVHPNDVRIDATSQEVVMTFALVTGDTPRVAQEVARLVLTWPMLESLVASVGEILEQGREHRIEALKRQLRQLDT